MPVVGSMTVSIVEVVRVVTVDHRVMAAARTVGVVVGLMGDVDVVGALVPVALVGGVEVTVMQVVDVVPVGDGDMPTALSVRVGVVIVDGVGRGH